jgi:hypothetical protein
MGGGAGIGFAAAGLAAVVLMVFGALSGKVGLAYGGGGLFLLAALALGGRLWRAAPQEDPEAVAAGFARLIAGTWLWAGSAMLASYYLTDLSWQHAWQYGAGCILIGSGILAYARARAAPGSRLSELPWARAVQWATAMQGLAAVIAVGALLASEKVAAFGRDWAANVVFISGGLAIFALSAMAVLAERRR